VAAQVLKAFFVTDVAKGKKTKKFNKLEMEKGDI
jgi:hypothetical protein